MGYIDKSNPIEGFALKYLEVSPKSYEQKDDVYSAFVNFCTERKLPVTNKGLFGTYLPMYVPVKTEYKRIRGKRTYCWRGIRLKEEGRK